MKSKKRVECPTCGDSFNMDSWLRIGSQFLCPNCEEMLEIVRLNPTEVDCVFSTGKVDLEDLGWDVDVWQKKAAEHD